MTVSFFYACTYVHFLNGVLQHIGLLMLILLIKEKINKMPIYKILKIKQWLNG